MAKKAVEKVTVKEAYAVWKNQLLLDQKLAANKVGKKPGEVLAQFRSCKWLREITRKVFPGRKVSRDWSSFTRKIQQLFDLEPGIYLESRRYEGWRLGSEATQVDSMLKLYLHSPGDAKNFTQRVEDLAETGKLTTENYDRLTDALGSSAYRFKKRRLQLAGGRQKYFPRASERRTPKQKKPGEGGRLLTA